MNKLMAVMLAMALCQAALVAQEAAAEATRLYEVHQTTVLQGIPKDARRVEWWISIPNDERHQEVLDFRVVSAPGTQSIRRDLDRGQRFLHVSVENPGVETLTVVYAVTVRRSPVVIPLERASAATIEDSHRRLLAAELQRDEPHMQVTPHIAAMADAVCGAERSVTVQARKLLAHVAATVDHYSKDPAKPHCGVGDAEACLKNGGGCCTDLHALFIALARARGIPARLQMGYRVQAKNLGKEVDPGYRCWVEYFVPGEGWVPADIVEADADGGLGPQRWFSGLTERRIWLNEGRQFRFAGSAARTPISTMVIGHAEIDGVAARVLPEGDLPAQLSRRVLCVEIAPGNTALGSKEAAPGHR